MGGQGGNKENGTYSHRFRRFAPLLRPSGGRGVMCRAIRPPCSVHALMPGRIWCSAARQAGQHSAGSAAAPERSPGHPLSLLGWLSRIEGRGRQSGGSWRPRDRGGKGRLLLARQRWGPAVVCLMRIVGVGAAHCLVHIVRAIRAILVGLALSGSFAYRCGYCRRPSGSAIKIPLRFVPYAYRVVVVGRCLTNLRS